MGDGEFPSLRWPFPWPRAKQITTNMLASCTGFIPSSCCQGNIFRESLRHCSSNVLGDIYILL